MTIRFDPFDSVAQAVLDVAKEMKQSQDQDTKGVGKALERKVRTAMATREVLPHVKPEQTARFSRSACRNSINQASAITFRNHCGLTADKKQRYSTEDVDKATPQYVRLLRSYLLAKSAQEIDDRALEEGGNVLMPSDFLNQSAKFVDNAMLGSEFQKQIFENGCDAIQNINAIEIFTLSNIKKIAPRNIKQKLIYRIDHFKNKEIQENVKKRVVDSWGILNERHKTRVFGKKLAFDLCHAKHLTANSPSNNHNDCYDSIANDILFFLELPNWPNQPH